MRSQQNPYGSHNAGYVDRHPRCIGLRLCQQGCQDDSNLGTQPRELRVHGTRHQHNIGIVAIRENIDTREGSAAAKFFRRSMLAQRAYQVDSASERIRLGLDRARASGKRVGRPPALTHEQVEQCRSMAGEGAGLRQIAREMGCSPATVKKVMPPGGK